MTSPEGALNSAATLAVLIQPAPVISIASRELYPLMEQQEMAVGLPTHGD